MRLLGTDISFPPVEEADEHGLLAIGGDLEPARILEAYRCGIFPWYNEEDPICWWSPDPRFVLFPEKLNVSKTMKQVINRKQFHFTINKAFNKVIHACATAKRKEAGGTWIHGEMEDAYIKLHERGFAISAEAWSGEELVGGLYGVRMGNLFFGESMFSLVSNASKFAFIKLVESLKREGLQLVDCQMYTPHLESLGAEMISRKSFMKIIHDNIA